MRAHEFIFEADGKIPKTAEQATKGTHRMRDVGGYDRIYHMNRMMMAMAQADGKSKKPVKMDSASYVEKYNTAHPYTEEEHNMLHQAMKTIPTDHKEIVPWSKSMEMDDTHKVSPIKGFKGYARK